ncbi:unnamed protein product [Dovyalis caffra]|uniref:Calponin-homology (CH) domain-containing protein n=1 Tax=Dovyalis caffra TaxID=77055 RepID=A0AAV1R3V2_9ROSI|nr:unnamed protein product [Dovyalis caffra]
MALVMMASHGESPQVLRASSAASVGAGVGETTTTSSSSCSSPCSSAAAESNFRELDDVFLQTQARIWLGEVLQTRLDEQLHIADLLADGELLFEVSRALWKMLSTKHTELRYVKAYKYESFAGSRYMPYSNVDSFLKVCKILGLEGIDLFSPSDVVEKRNTRKVCMCIRSVSKKARSRHLNVPDFDIVTYTIAMPTNMVGNIRRTLELSHCSFSSSATTSQQESRQRSRLKHSNTTSGRNDDSYFEESPDVESAFMLESASSCSSCSNDISSPTNSDSIYSPGVKGYPSEQFSLELENEDLHRGEFSKCQWQKDCLNESTRSLCSKHLENDHQLDGGLSPSFAESNICLGSRSFHTEDGATHSCGNNGIDLIHVDLSLEDDALVVGDSGDCSTPRRNHSDDVEVSSIASMSSVSGPVRNLNFEDQLDAEDDFKTIWFPESPNKKVAFSVKKPTERFESQDKVIYYKTGDSLTTDSEEESPFDMKVMDIGFSSKLSVPSSNAQTEHSDHAFLHKNDSCMSQVNTDLGYGEDRELFADWSSFSHEFHLWDQKGKCRISVVPTRASPLSLSCVDLPEENLYSVQSKLAGDGHALWPVNTSIMYIVGDNDTEEHNATMVESDPDNKQPNKCLQTTWFNSIENETYKESDSPDSIAAMVESEKSREFDSREDSSGFQHLCDTYVFCSQGEQIPDELICSTTEYLENVGETSGQVSIEKKKDMICSTENKGQVDDKKHEKVQIPAIEDSNVTENLSVGKADCKPPRRPFLKTFAKGTAVVGVLLFLLHFRKNDREKTRGSVKKPNQPQKANGLNFSSPKNQKGRRTDGLYPAEKLRFGN